MGKEDEDGQTVYDPSTLKRSHGTAAGATSSSESVETDVAKDRYAHAGKKRSNLHGKDSDTGDQEVERPRKKTQKRTR